MNTSLQPRVDEIVAKFADDSRSVVDLLVGSHDPADVAYVVVGDGEARETFTYADLADRSARIASVLAEHGVGPGSRVATLMSKSFELPATIVAAWRLGATYLPLFTAFAGDAIADRLERSGAAVVVSEAAQAAKIPDGAWTVLVVDEGDYAARVAEADPTADVSSTSPDAPLVHMFTSGTTGKPKGVVHTRHHLAGWEGYLRFALGVDTEGTFWSAADPGWAYGLYTVLLGPLTVGVPSIISTEKFTAERTWEILEQQHVTDFAASPTALRAMKNARPAATVSSLRRLSTAGEPLNADLLEWSQGLGWQVHDHFGQTELGMCAGFPHNAPDAPGPKPSATGVSLPGWTLEVLKLGEDLPADDDEVGRFAVDIPASPFMSFVGYGTDRDNRSDKFVADGRYYVTGDLATRDADGVFHFTSRDDDVILMAGYRIGPFDIESTLAKHPDVTASAVVGVPDEDRGEIAHAFVVLRPEATGDDALVGKLQEFVKTTYARHAYPRRITFVDELPATPSGKIRRNVLRERAREN